MMGDLGRFSYTPSRFIHLNPEQNLAGEPDKEIQYQQYHKHHNKTYYTHQASIRPLNYHNVAISFSSFSIYLKF